MPTRRTGKSTVCEATVAALRRRRFYAVSVSLFRDTNAAALAETLAQETLANRSALKRLVERARRLPSRALAGRSLTTVLRVKSELGDAGDCNKTIPDALTELKALNWAPTFAFVDPDGMEVAWDTLRVLADHKRGYRSSGSTKPEYKVELWMLFPTSGIVRTLALKEEKVSDADIARATRLFGTDGWKPIHELRVGGSISGAEAREEHVNLMRWRLERVLGYRFAHPFELKNTKGSTLYHMIFATDSFDRPQIAVITGMVKGSGKKFSDRDYAKVKALGDQYSEGFPRPIAS